MTDGPFGSSLTSSHYSDEGARVIRLGNIGAARFKDADAAFISMSYFRELRRHEVKAGDLLIAGLGDDRHPVGRACIAPDRLGPAIVKADCYRVRLDENQLTHRFAAWALGSSTVSDQVSASTRGSTRSRINLEVAREILLPVPPVEEQRRIADFLDAETARIDSLDTSRSAQLNLLAERERAMLDRSFREARSATRTRLKYLFSVRPRYGVLVPVFTDEGVPFIRVNDLLDLEGRADGLRNIPSELSAQYARSVVQPGDLLMSVVGTLGRAAIAPASLAGANIARAVCSMRFKPEVEVELVKSWLGTSAFHKQALVATSTDTAQPTLGMEDLGNFALTWPSDPQERKHLVREIARIQDSMRRLSGKLERQKSVLAERRQALITAAVTGQIDVSTASGRGIEE
ncbi:restriction endonuclease subunit S [Streptomyces mirabilis]|uniref:restriction endonuclease subunit S n=1 Tax=Streptomyces mirabilis TaxID=68239 RepID=UPI0036619774